MSLGTVLLWIVLAAAAARCQPAFDVASVKPSSQDWLMVAPQRTGGRIVWTTDLQYLIGYAYRLPAKRILGAVPGSESLYSIEAKTSADASDDQVRRMFQALLAERFRMAVHWESKEVEGYALSPGKRESKMEEARAGEDPPALPEWLRGKVTASELEGRTVAFGQGSGVTAIIGRGVTMAQFCQSLERFVQTFVTDGTGLAGRYYFAFRYSDEGAADTEVPSLFTAVQEAMGLRLEKHRGPIGMLVVDHLEKTPTEN
jgi:uncharacterized protein (TIGR03435 family)